MGFSYSFLVCEQPGSRCGFHRNPMMKPTAVVMVSGLTVVYLPGNDKSHASYCAPFATCGVGFP